MAPECFVRPQEFGGIVDDKVDIWSLGVVFFEMLFGQQPYTNVEEIMQFGLVESSFPPIDFPTGRVSNEAKEFIQMLLAPNPSRRPCIRQLFGHPYIKKQWGGKS